MSTDYIYVKDHLEGQVIKNTDTEEVERFKERQAVELAKKQEFYQQRKKERGLDNG